MGWQDDTLQAPAATASEDPPPPSPPGFELLGEAGRGGMGAVFRARDLALGREVAVKVLQGRYPPDSPAAQRFLDEARVTAQLQHPGVPAVYQVGTLADGRPFLAMKLIRGQTLDALLKAGEPLDVPAVFEAVCQTVGYAHAHGVLHRDLKPANVMVGAFGEVQVMDWGLAKVAGAGGPARGPVADVNPPAPRARAGDPEATTATTEIRPLRDSDGSFTQAGSVLGTPAFMAPEQARGETDRVSARSDVFGLGAVLYAMLTGRPPFEGNDPEEARLAAAQGPTEAALARLDRPGADPGLAALCKECLALDPSVRPADARAVAAAVSALRRAADERAREAERERLRADVRRRTVQRAAAVVAGVLLLGIAGTTVGMYRAERARRHAVDKEEEANAVVGFVEERVFAAARPVGQDGGLGKDATLRQAIDASLPALTADFADRPLVEARLRLALGLTLRFMADFEAAKTQGERALALYERALGRGHLDTLKALNHVANCLIHLGRSAEAVPLYEEVLRRRRAALPADHPDVLHAMHNLAGGYLSLDRLEEGDRLREEVLAARRRVLPPGHPQLLHSLSELALARRRAGRLDEAVRLGEEVLAGLRRMHPPEHREVLYAMADLAEDYDGLGRREEALKLQEEVYAVRRRVLPAGHPDVAWSMNDVANTYRRLGRVAEAVRLQEEARAIQRRALPAGHRHLERIANDLAVSYAMAGRPADAIKLFEELLESCKKRHGPDHDYTLDYVLGVAENLGRMGRAAEAAARVEECFAAARRTRNAVKMLTAALMLQKTASQANPGPACRRAAEMWEAAEPADGVGLYNAACFRAVAASHYARAGRGADAQADADRAMAWLLQAVAAGYKDAAHMAKDKDLDHLRGREDFKRLMESLAGPSPAAGPAK